MSYASVLAENAPPLEEQPQPNSNLLEGQAGPGRTPTEGSSPKLEPKQDVDRKKDEKDEDLSNRSQSESEQGKGTGPGGRKKVEKKAKKVTKDPAKKFQALSLVNLLALIGTGWIASKHWEQSRWDKRVVSGFVVGLGVLFGSQGYLGKSVCNLIGKKE